MPPPNTSDLAPTSVSDDYWIHAFREGLAYPPSTERGGKWLIFLGPKFVDEIWAAIRAATKNGLLGGESKVSTRKPNPLAKSPNDFVICVYTYDGDDVKDVTRVRDELRKLGIMRPISWKADSATHEGRYAAFGDTSISAYRS